MPAAPVAGDRPPGRNLVETLRAAGARTLKLLPRMRHPALVAALFVAGSASPALALEQGTHKDISREACKALGLTNDFCDRVGVEAYNVDRWEWETMAAHAQIAPGQDACQGADSAVGRVAELGADIRNKLFDFRNQDRKAATDGIAKQLGRALHTVQDNCAHHGITNIQHAWYSLSDTCHGTSMTPDTKPEAAECAKRETAAVMDAFRQAMEDAGITHYDMRSATDRWGIVAPLGGVCKYLDSANEWDGRDTAWNNDVVVPLLRAKFSDALRGVGNEARACANGPIAASVFGDLDTSGGMSSCWYVKAGCAVFRDSPFDADMGGEDLDPDENIGEEEQGGCNAGGAGGLGLAFGAMAGMLVLRRRRTK